MELESPIEEKFWDAWCKMSSPRGVTNMLIPQYQVMNGKYRIDFAEPELKLAIELDGHTWHSSKGQFTKDRKRQRELEALGWRVIRFSGKEILDNPIECVMQVMDAPGRIHVQKHHGIWVDDIRDHAMIFKFLHNNFDTAEELESFVNFVTSTQ